MKKTPAENKPTWNCEYCRRTFVRESTLQNHLCEQRRRWDARDQLPSRLAYDAWLRFYSRYQPSKTKKSYRDFTTSNYYNGFIKYGNYCVEVDVLVPHAYSDWLLKSRVPLDNWTSDRIYTQYLLEYLVLEDSLDAVHRSIVTMSKLADEQNIRIGDVLRLVNANKLCYLITKGKLSPWLLYSTDIGKRFLSELNQDQQDMVMDYINPDVWSLKLTRNSSEVGDIRALLGQAGL